MSCHLRSARFRDIGFESKVIFTSRFRNLVETHEASAVTFYDSYNSGLNLTKHGAGYGHGHHNFSTLGFKFSETSRAKMSVAAKRRGERESSSGIRAIRSTELWNQMEYRNSQTGKRKGKRLRPPKLSDEQVAEIRIRFANESSKLQQSLDTHNAFRKSRGYRLLTPERLFANEFCKSYDVTNVCINSILTNKSRIKCLPPLYKS
jgi:hypothetical protein